MNRFNQKLADFHTFYHELPDKQKIYYLFFTGGLLFWLDHAMSLIPDHINTVLIGSNLSDDEIRWIRQSYQRPIFTIDTFVDDRTVWNLLFEINQNHFGWIDIDCFVFNPSLFDEMSMIHEKTVFNSIWSWENQTGLTFQSTHMLFANVDAIHNIQKQVDVTPFNYCYPGSDPSKTQNARILSQQQQDLISDLVPWGQYPIPNGFDHGLPFFDTLLLYQAFAYKYGYTMCKVRDLTHANYFSNEIVHIGDSSYFTDQRSMKPKFIGSNLHQYLKFSYLLLKNFLRNASDIPKQYFEKKKLLAFQLQSQGIEIRNIRNDVEEFFLGAGILDVTISRLLGDS